MLYWHGNGKKKSEKMEMDSACVPLLALPPSLFLFFYLHCCIAIFPRSCFILLAWPGVRNAEGDGLSPTRHQEGHSPQLQTREHALMLGDWFSQHEIDYFTEYICFFKGRFRVLLSIHCHSSLVFYHSHSTKVVLIDSHGYIRHFYFYHLLSFTFCPSILYVLCSSHLKRQMAR